MSALEDRIHQSFDAVTLPPEVKEATLTYIESKTASQRIPATEQMPEHHLPEPTTNAVPSMSGAEVPTREVSPVPPYDTSAKPIKSRRRKPLIFTRRAGFALAACLLLCAIGVGGFNAYAEETAIVGVDLNPSIELGVNRFNRVVDARAVNDDGQAVLDEVSVIGLSYEEALAKIAGSEAFSTYIYDDSFINITVVCEDTTQSSYLVEQSDKEIESLPYAGACHQMSSEAHHEAQEAGMGMGRYAAAQVLMDLDPSITLEECSAMTMRQMRDRITELDPDNSYAHHGVSHEGTMNGHGQGKGQGKGHRYGRE